MEYWEPIRKGPQPWASVSFMRGDIAGRKEDVFWTGNNVAWDAQPTAVPSVQLDVWAQLQESSACVEGQSGMDEAVDGARSVRQRAGGGGGTGSSTSTSKHTQPQHQATPPLLLRSPDPLHAPPRQPYPTSRPSQHGLPLAKRFLPDDDVFRTDFRGSKFSWSIIIIDKVMIASACGKFRKCIFCIPNRSAKKWYQHAERQISSQKDCVVAPEIAISYPSY